MALKYVKGDILDAKIGIITHSCNCFLVFGAGLAKQIKDKYPRAYTECVAIMGKAEPRNRLGKAQIVEVIPGSLFICNAFGQYHYGRGNTVYTDYNALAQALYGLNDWHSKYCPPDFPIYIPHGIGSGLGRGDKDIIHNIIKNAVPNAVIVRKEG